MTTTADELRRVALEEFASAGYHATSIQQIADRAGVSKATVLYHFASKEVLLESALAPAIDQLDGILGKARLAALRTGGEQRAEFLRQFVDFLLQHRSAASIFVNQATTLEDVPIVRRANAEIQLVSGYLEENVGSLDEKVRFGVALGGAAYLLAGAPLAMPVQDLDAMRAALITVLGDLLAVTPALASAPTTSD
ncbi:MAG: TetR/AcrR family transcriptional regulator [Acidobacteria bacterium]|nr:TetR/AcrR family transcriptional regulator [Acidobacteriota bacterium]